MEKEKDEPPREHLYDDDDENDEAATRASWKNVPGGNMECPHLAQGVQFGDDNVEGSSCAAKDLPFVCAGRHSYKAPREKESLLPILSQLERDGEKKKNVSAMEKETDG